MAFTRGGTVAHTSLSGVTATNHHTATVAADLALADLATRAHTDLSDAPADAHHSQGHNIAGHSDTTATGVELDSLTDASLISIHQHSNNARIATGVYTGDGAEDQGITGIGFKPIFVWIQMQRTSGALMDTDEAQMTTDKIIDDIAGGASMIIESGTAGRSSITAGRVNSLDADGFSVDDQASDANPNTLNQVYNFLALV